MGADQINFAIRYREKDGIFDRPKREEIEEFIIDYSNTAGVGAEEGTNCVHRSQYSQITFDTCYGHIGAFCGLPKEMARLSRENQQLLKQPIVRNGKLATVGYQPDVWKQWE